MQCKARYCREKRELTFPLKSGYFTELRCGNLAAGDGPDPELCEKCVGKASKPFRVGCQQGQYQGKIDEPYFEGSWIFGSDRFQKYNTLPGNTISPDDTARAEAAQKIARQGSEMKEKADPKMKPSETKKESKIKIKEKTKKPLENKVIQPNSVKLPLPLGIELLDEPLQALEVVKIKVKKLEVDGQLYWLDNISNDVYECSKQMSIGKKLGRWNTDEEILESEIA